MNKKLIKVSNALLLTEFKHIFRVMKLTSLFGVLCVSSAFAINVNSQSLRVNIHANQKQAKEVIKQIEEQTDYLFVYNHDKVNLNNTVTIQVNNETVAEVLNQMFAGTDIIYAMQGNNILLMQKDAVTQQSGKVVTGTIVDPSGMPVIGANVMVKGTTNGTITDMDGKFSLEVEEGATLQISYIGYANQEIKVGNQKTLSIALKEDAEALDELVVVGYGTQKKVNLTGAVETAGKELFEGRSFPNTTQALQGAVPNLNINLADGKAHRTASFNIRGTTSIGQGGSALILIDGVEGDPSLLNPNDIASISVLKDAASAAIYGARAAFGVVLITTKTPQKGKISINYTGNYSLRSIAKRPEYVTDGVTYLEHYRQAWWNQNGTVPENLNGFQPYSDAWLERMRDWKASGEGPKTDILPNGNYEYYCNMDYYDLLYKKQSFAQDHNLNISGGSEKSDFYMSGRFYGFDGMFNFNPDNYKAYNIRAKGGLMLTKWLRITNNMEFSRDYFHQPLFGAASGYLTPERCIQVTGFPTIPIFNPDGTYTRSAAFGIGGLIDKFNYRDNTRSILKNTVGFNVNLLDNTLRFNGDYTFSYNIDERFEKAVKVSFYDNSNTTVPTGYFGNELGSILERTGRSLYTSSNLYAEYERNFVKDHYLKVMIGWNYETSTYKRNDISRNGLLVDEAESIQLATGESIYPSADYIRWRTLGTFFRLNYGYKNRYLLEINGRYDGSSRFPIDQQWGFFPSISGAWRISEEPFWFKNDDILSDVKLRASYGSLGNGNISPYQYLDLLYVANSGLVLDGGLHKRTSAPNPIPAGLTWEKSTTANIGLDLGLVKNKLRLNVDYYVRKTTDMYVPGPTLPDVFGASSPKGNYAGMTTNGFELSIDWHDQFILANKVFKYQVRASLYDYVSTIDKYNNPTKRFTDYYEGMTLGEIWGFKTDGLFQYDPSPEEYVNTIFTSSSDSKWHAGDLKIQNLDGSLDNMITKGDQTVDNPGDMTIIGNSLPRYQYNFSLNADWNGVFLSALFQGVGKMNWYPGAESAFWGQYNRAYNQIPTWHLNNYWTSENTEAYLPRYRGGQNPPVFEANDRYLQNVAYLMLKNLQVGYSIPVISLSKVGVKNVRIYLSGENLVSWSPFYKVAKKGMHVLTAMGTTDPDGDASFNQGSGNGYPLLKTISLGVSVTF